MFQRFVSAFAQAGRPLVVFLDDLQWLDPATLALVEYLVVHPDTRHVHLIGAYRDNEVAANDPLMSTIASMRAAAPPSDNWISVPWASMTSPRSLPMPCTSIPPERGVLRS